jgi:hypothetical protein
MRLWIFNPSPTPRLLIQVCSIPSALLKNKYVDGRSKSFEWYLGLTSWRASAAIWNQDSYYRHSKSGERLLADAGWHCSYCFRSLPEYIVKMKGFSHADRIAGRLNLLDPKRIQDTICKGKDIFGMFPEAYTVSKPNSTTTKFLTFCSLVCRLIFSDEPPTVSGDR